jgi:ankyrin repeat protein
VKALLEKGADPNLRVRRKIWYAQYNFDLLPHRGNRRDAVLARGLRQRHRRDEIAARVRSRSEHRDDEAAGEQSLPAGWHEERRWPRRYRHPADSNRRTRYSAAARPRPAPVTARDFAANAHRFAPTGMLAAVKFLVEELHADVNARDADGNTALHNAASRGDNEMIQYLVSKGADVKAVNRSGQTTVDMANGPVQRTQPYPETIKLLESLGAKNNHKCVSC